MIEVIWGFMLGSVATGSLMFNRLIKKTPVQSESKSYGFRRGE